MSVAALEWISNDPNTANRISVFFLNILYLRTGLLYRDETLVVGTSREVVYKEFRRHQSSTVSLRFDSSIEGKAL